MPRSRSIGIHLRFYLLPCSTQTPSGGKRFIFHDKMSRYLRQYEEKEHMKMAMLKQEETFKQQVQELHRLYRVQQLLMTGMSNTVPSVRYKPDDDRRAQRDDEAGSSRSWDSEQRKAPPPTVIQQQGDLDLTLAIGSLVTAEMKTTKKDTSSSADSRTSISSSSTDSGSPPDCRVLPPHPSQHAWVVGS